MKTLLIYDNEGVIISRESGQPAPRLPVGLPYIYDVIPKGKSVVGIDVSKSPHEIILEDIPKSEAEILREELASTQLALAELAETLLGGE